jgi:hypothetical protein
VIQHQPHRAGTDLRRELVACLLAHGSTFSRVGASGKPGAVQRVMHTQGLLDYDSVAFAILVVGMGAIELLALSIFDAAFSD